VAAEPFCHKKFGTSGVSRSTFAEKAEQGNAQDANKPHTI
jgi:hypothetical protein